MASGPFIVLAAILGFAASALIASCTHPSEAGARTPALAQERADAAAHELADTTVELFTDPAAESVRQLDGYELDACDVESRRRAYCDVTFNSSAGGCDGLIAVTILRRGRVIADFDVFDCDPL